jgi:hypothetical protein
VNLAAGGLRALPSELLVEIMMLIDAPEAT